MEPIGTKSTIRQGIRGYVVIWMALPVTEENRTEISIFE